jgi:hypothetical protein
MTVKVTQLQKPVAKVKDSLKSAALSKDTRAAIDRLWEIEQKLAPMRALLKEEKKIREHLSEVASNTERFDPKMPAILEGDAAVLEYGAASSTREISNKDGAIQLLKEKMGGYEKLLAIIKINLGDLDQYTTEEERAPFVKSVVGSRKFTTIKGK